MRLLVYSNRHAIKEINNLRDNDYLVLKDKRSINLWYYTMDYYNINKKINIVLLDELLEGKLGNMQFDYIIQNPPYQKQVGPDKTESIWDKIVVKTYGLLKPGGEMTSIHPGGWRFATNNSRGYIKEVKKIYQSNKITKMGLNDIEEGRRVFGVGTDYDEITLSKEPAIGTTCVNTKSEEEVYIDISNLDVIPTDNFKVFNKILANKDNEKVDFIFDSNYHTANTTQNEKTENFRYPVLYTITEKGGAVFWYSNTQSKGHFGLPKLMLKKGATSTLLDLNGSYGMTQFAAAIVDEPENLVKMQKALESSEFKRLKSYFCGSGQSHSKNSIIDGLGTMFKFIKSFRKDFWKEFYTPEMEQELINEGKLDENGKYIE